MDYKNDFHSDDDFDCSNGYNDCYNGTNGSGQAQMSNSHGLSKAELRKTNKPIMEKRRRARINHCLNELKSLILEAMKKDPARHTKLEKADILEMTVKHLQSVQRQQLNMAIQTDPTVVHKFKTGFIECAEEVNRYINQLDGVDAVVRQRLINHLNSCASNLEQLGSMTNFNNGYRGQLAMGMSAPGGLFGAALPANPLSMASATAPSALFPPLPQDLNNNSNNGGAFVNSLNAAAAPLPPVQMGGVQLIPSRLPSGEFALIMPSTHANLLNTSNHNNSNPPFSSFPHGRNPAAVISPVATATATTATAPVLSLPPASVPINDFAANYKRLSAFGRLPTAPTQLPLNQAVHSGAPNSSNCHPSSNGALVTAAAPQSQQQQLPARTAPAHHQLHHNSSMATNSPPLSPISSASPSSQGDDSLMHTSSDFTGSRPATPPLDVTGDFDQQQHNFSGVFSTPSSAESSLTTSSTSTLASSARLSLHLQQQQVSSTSGNASSSCNTSTNSGNNNTNNDCSDSGIELNVSLKRPLDDEADSSDASEAPASKKIALESKNREDEASKLGQVEEQQQFLVKQKHRLQELKEDSDNMWRPW
ncbi:PREDICTED: protein deadpan isoform X1 [Rhagoletis zephyria]|uniref:protein deadpan isoform X1 n=1 Tax=Rhagoletis zephyria TaxID=28612 RepID=UPI0008119EA7|nr:PREDICTED: protein deadpan isoform X1 [Rhagoletis zephyria]